MVQAVPEAALRRLLKPGMFVKVFDLRNPRIHPCKGLTVKLLAEKKGSVPPSWTFVIADLDLIVRKSKRGKEADSSDNPIPEAKGPKKPVENVSPSMLQLAPARMMRREQPQTQSGVLGAIWDWFRSERSLETSNAPPLHQATSSEESVAGDVQEWEKRIKKTERTTTTCETYRQQR